MDASLIGRKVAVLIEQDFEDVELAGPRDALLEAGAQVVFVGPTAGVRYRGKQGLVVAADVAAASAQADDFDALVIPGGHAPDRMRLKRPMVDLARDMMQAGKPVAAICHGPQVLISARVVEGRTLTCWPSIAIDIRNAGGLYVDRAVAVDGNLITSRKPDDVPKFNKAILEALAALP